MTSLLALAWRKATCTSSSAHYSRRPSSVDTEQPDLQPGVTASSSGETSNPISSNSLFGEDIISSCLAGPDTPDALRGRRLPKEIREELGLAPRKLAWQQADPSSTHVEPGCDYPSCSLLPPMFGNCGALASPQVSTSSFYSRRSQCTENVAASPYLKVGHAKTAVGALVALTDSRYSKPPMSPSRGSAQDQHESTILPSRAWLQDDRSVDEADDFSVELPYESLNDSKGCLSPKACTFQEDSISDDESSIHASPSSNRHDVFVSRNIPETSFTRGFLEAETNQFENNHYDFNPVIDKDLVVADDLDPNMSCMSQTTAREMEPMCSMGGGVPPINTIPYKPSSSEEVLLRSQNDRRIKEDLLLSTLERLQDDNEIVLEVMEAIRKEGGGEKPFLCPGENNLFAGFSQSSRSLILANMDAQLMNLRSDTKARDQELVGALSFCRSLVHASVPASEKIASIKCSSTAYAPQHTHRWRRIYGLRSALGFDEAPQSPQTIRGGDTSLFSLPSESANESTPHTSNVSMTSTISSAVSPENRNRQAGHFLRKDSLQESMRTLCTCIDELGAECFKIEDLQSGNVQYASGLRQIYRRLFSVSNDDLKGLIDSFELELLSISRMVSNDDGDDADEDTSEPLDFESQRFPFMRSWASIDDGRPQNTTLSIQPTDYHLIEEEEPEVRENQDIFSPTTLDMRSTEISRVESTDTVEEDLRRTVGSFDRDEEAEDREAPPTMSQRSRRNKWGKGRLSIFNRRNFRRRQAAE